MKSLHSRISSTPRPSGYQQEPADALLSKLVHAEIDGQRLDPRALVNIMFQILVAGHETTTSAIGSAILTFLQNPEIRSKLVVDIKLIPNFVEEALRQHPPVLSGFRKVMRDTEVNGSRAAARCPAVDQPHMRQLRPGSVGVSGGH